MIAGIHYSRRLQFDNNGVSGVSGSNGVTIAYNEIEAGDNRTIRASPQLAVPNQLLAVVGTPKIKFVKIMCRSRRTMISIWPSTDTAARKRGMNLGYQFPFLRADKDGVGPAGGGGVGHWGVLSVQSELRAEQSDERAERDDSSDPGFSGDCGPFQLSVAGMQEFSVSGFQFSVGRVTSLTALTVRSTIVTQRNFMQELILEAGRAERHYWRDLWRYRELFLFSGVAGHSGEIQADGDRGNAWSLIRPIC